MQALITGGALVLPRSKPHGNLPNRCATPFGRLRPRGLVNCNLFCPQPSLISVVAAMKLCRMVVLGGAIHTLPGPKATERLGTPIGRVGMGFRPRGHQWLTCGGAHRAKNVSVQVGRFSCASINDGWCIGAPEA